MNTAQTGLVKVPPSSITTRKPRFQNLCVPVAGWHPEDRAIWSRAQQRSRLFDRAAKMAGLAAETISGREQTYGALVAYLKVNGAPGALSRPVDLITADTMTEYTDFLRQRLKASSIHEELNRLAATLRILAPDRDWGWIRRLPNAPSRAEIEQSKKRISPPDPAVVLNAALAQFDAASSKPPCVLASVEARDGLIIAFAALFALRRKNLGEIERGTHLLEDASTVRLSFSDTLKNRTGILFDIPHWLMPRLTLYLTQHRPRLLGKTKDHGGLWVSRRGTQLSPITIAMIFNDFGNKKLGRQLNCHVLRHAMASTIIVRNPGDNDLAAAALGHRTTKMVDEVYSKSASRELTRVWQRKLRARKRQLGLEN